MKTIFSKKNNSEKKGFTLVELMVVVSIIATISALSLFNSSKLNSAVLLSNTAYEIGLVIRDAQISGLGAKVMSSGGFATTSNQGIFFDINTPEKIVFFADMDKNNKYNSNPDEASEVFGIENKRAGKITKICKIDNNNTCSDLSELTIMFKRPNPEAYFYTSVNDTVTEYQGSVAINIGFDDGGDCRSIVIYKTGAIQIDRNFCPPITN